MQKYGAPNASQQMFSGSESESSSMDMTLDGNETPQQYHFKECHEPLPAKTIQDVMMVFDVDLDFLKDFCNTYNQGPAAGLSPMRRFMSEQNDAPFSSVNRCRKINKISRTESPSSKTKSGRSRSSANNKNAGSDPLKKVKKGNTSSVASTCVQKKRQKKSQSVKVELSESAHTPSIAGSEARRSSIVTIIEL